MRFVRERLTFANVCSFLALTVALGTGGAYAANTIGSPDVIDNSLQSVDIKDGEVKSADIGTSQILGSRIIDGTIKAADLADNGVTSSDLTDNGTLSKDIADGAVQSADVKDEDLTGIDIKNESIGAVDAKRREFLPYGSDLGKVEKTLPANGEDGYITSIDAGCVFDDEPVGAGKWITVANGGYITKDYAIYQDEPVDTDSDGDDDVWRLGLMNLEDEPLYVALTAKCIEQRNSVDGPSEPFSTGKIAATREAAAPAAEDDSRPVARAPKR